VRPSTFSIVACDLDRREWGVAVASKFLAVGAVVTWAKAEVGAVATQARAKVGYGPDGLAHLEQGKSAEETLQVLIDADDDRAERQVGIVDRAGRTAAHTGAKCIEWAGHRLGEAYSCQGNILVGSGVLEAMAESFEASSGELADRMVSALCAGDEAGGDKRGKQSAAVLVVRKGGGYGGDTDRYVDLRVDDDPEPARRLQELLAMHHVFFKPAINLEFIPIEAEVARELQRLTRRLGYYSGEVNGEWDQASRDGFEALLHHENLEERWSQDDDSNVIDRVALDYLRLRFG